MSEMLEYKGYTARVGFDAEDRLFFGRLAGIEDGVGFHADTVEELVAAFHEAVEDYLETCGRVGKEPERSTPGVLELRLGPDLRAGVVEAARDAGQSVDEFGAAAFREMLARLASRRLAAMGGTEPDFRAPTRRGFD